MKTRLFRWLAPLVLASGLAGCGASDGNDMNGNGPSSSGAGASGTLSAAEVQSVTRMREEEKMARDVYGVLAPHAPAFSMIATSEQKHMDAVLGLLSSHGLADPAGGKDPGEFTDATLASVYSELIARGQPSLQDALSVGVEIEDLDLLDLMAATSTVEHQDVSNVYENLMRGSRNHLRTFCSQLQAAGGTCAAKHLDEATFQSIVGSPAETGGPQGW
jgi:hypothetical protein